MTRFASSKIIVLIVEDEALIRMDAVDMVEEAGFIAMEAENADEAIRLLEAYPEIRVVFTDIEMPGSMDGLKLARAIRERWPPVVLMLASGRIRPGLCDLPADTHFFPKPYAPSVIQNALRQVA